MQHKRILNLGSGNETYGTDRLDIHLTSATTHVADIEKGIPFPPDTFDEVYAKNILEHLRNVGFVLGEVERVLKKGGQLIIITDNAACLKYYGGTHTGRYERLHEGDCHYSLFTMNHLENHVKATGLSLVETRYLDTNHPSRILDSFLREIGLGYLSYPRICLVARK